MKSVKILLTAFLLLGTMLPAHATSVADFEKMTADEKSKFMLRATDNLLAKVKEYDPTLAKKTSAFFYNEKNKYGYAKGCGEVLGTIVLAKKERPDALDKIQVETVIKVVMRRFWKEQGITVPKTIFDGKSTMKDTVISTNCQPVAPVH